MSVTIYSNKFVRGAFTKALVDYLGLDNVKFGDYEDPAFEANFPLKKVPSLLGPKGVKLTEVLAITFYLLDLAPSKKEELLGAPEQLPYILRWFSLSGSELIVNLANAFKPLEGRAPYNKKNVDAALANAEKIATIFEDRLVNYTFLVGERLTLADLFAFFISSRGFATVWGADFRKKFPALTRWHKTVLEHPFVANSEYAKTFSYIEKPLEYVPPKKEKKEKKAKPEQAPKKEEKKAEKKEEVVEEKKKPKHPLELLGKLSKNLRDWKVMYSNEDTRPTALPWFWKEFYNPDEWSLWKVDYKYNDELTLTFMSNNLVGGFFNRLSASINYLFGCLVVYGENNNNGITGAFLVRGQDFKPAFDVAPDWESYEFTKLDPTKAEDKAFIENSWAWDEPMIVNGEKREIADGKVCK